MSEQKSKSVLQTEQAMQQVLQAERDAERAIVNCRIQSRQSIHDVKSSVQRIDLRTNQRITNMEMRHSHKIKQLIKNMEVDAAAELKHDAELSYDQQLLQSIINDVASRICLGGSVSEEENTGVD